MLVRERHLVLAGKGEVELFPLIRHYLHACQRKASSTSRGGGVELFPLLGTVSMLVREWYLEAYYLLLNPLEKRNLRNTNKYEPPKCRTKRFKTNFIPYALYNYQ